jgi:hypothetical protein
MLLTTASPAFAVRTTVNSFDIFDTLVARRCVSPLALLAEVGVTDGRRDFVAARLAAEQRCASEGSYDISAIYRKLAAIGYCDDAQARRLMTAEIDAEFANATPIAENIAAVRDYDLVLSDMYLPATILQELLHHVGLRRPVHLFVGNDGKRSGELWHRLAKRWLITRHTGDNPTSDVAVPQGLGIPVTHYAGATLSAAETYLDELGLHALARSARALRLGNPFPTSTIEGAAWDHFVQFNLPLLALAAFEVRLRRQQSGRQRVLFVARDCEFLSEIFLALFPAESTAVIHTSRIMLASDGPTSAAYFAKQGVAGALVCDLVSTGLSWLRFCQASGCEVDFFSLVLIDNYQYQAFDAGELQRQPNFRFSHALRASAVTGFSKAIEAMNTAPHGSTLGITELDGAFAPVFADHHELPANVIASLVTAQAAAVRELRACRDQLLAEIDNIPDRREALETLVRSLCAPDWLNRLAASI